MAVVIHRKKSPRAPSVPLDDALEKVLKVYEKERLHPAPVDVVAQDMGYKDANNGRALAAMASLRYFGLLDRHEDGTLAVSKDVEAFKYAPNEELQLSYLRRFLSTPTIFAELLDRYANGLPSDGSLRYELIQRGFLPASAESLVAVFKRSAEFARVFEQPRQAETDSIVEPAHAMGANDAAEDASKSNAPASRPVSSVAQVDGEQIAGDDPSHDRIPVRLAGGRRAWLVIPPLFYEADKQRLKAQIDLLLTEEDQL